MGNADLYLGLRGAMPQGSWLGRLAFPVLADDLSIACSIHKNVDDTPSITV